eukprot:TRINITY_DN49328_c0_g1_i2.p1 TRINITY_DN49328_c0_g1~~TRINITY_DN49328_c0_g1_i2.p1  ORF type:complete len:388 (-),score=77.45 TRINITY_DN49328_c0_g1_i2:221-1240(-)
MAGGESPCSIDKLRALLGDLGLTGSECDGACLRLFVAGAVTHVGKTTVCLSLLAALRKAGIPAAKLAYIKPATQCEAPDLLSKWCAKEGIEYVAGSDAPLVFYSGFTRSFLNGEQGTSADWKARIAERLDQLAVGRKVLIVDGVGFPSVGSVVGVDNADVARAARAPVMLVCKSGVGGAIDSYSLNSTYFAAKGVPVLGALFNLADADGFYSAEKCGEAIQLWFNQSPDRRQRYYGTIPKAAQLDGLRERIEKVDEEGLAELAELNAAHFSAHVDIPAILADAAADPWNRSGSAKAVAAAPSAASRPAAVPLDAAMVFKPVSREAVSAKAAAAGARGGG